MASRQTITSAVRVRPLLPLETRNDSNCLSVDHNRITLAASPMLKQFQLPLIFDHRSSQQEVFDSLLLPLLYDLFRGYSRAFLCCGQNASGKTYTIEGGDTQETKGMIGRLVDYMTLKLEAENRTNTAYLLRVSYVEVCQEEIIDLLEVRRGKQPTVVEKGREVEFAGVGKKHVTSVNELEDYFINGNRKRRFAYKKKRRSAQKSTGIFTLYLESCSKDSRQDLKRGKLHIVDMSASRVNPPPLSPLSRHYDLSANALKNIVHSIVFGSASSKVPYQDSKVTMLLREYLGGFGRTSVLTHLSPNTQNLTTSIESIKMAKLLSQIENSPHCHPDPTQMTILRRLDELAAARERLLVIEEEKQRVSEIYEEEPEEPNENQFLTDSFARKKQIEELEAKLESLTTEKVAQRKKIQNLQSLFLKHETSQLTHANSREKYQLLMHPREVSSRQPEQETGLNRSARLEILEAHRQFEEEREVLLNRIRQLEGEYQFYQRVSQQTVKREELDILRHSSQYDQTKRTYDLPSFSITNKKISLAGRFYSPPPSITSRSLGSSVRSSNSNSMNFTKSRLAQRKPTAKQIRPISDAESEYLPMGNSKGRPKDNPKGSLRGIAKDSVKDSVNERMGCDDYEMVGLKSKDGMKSKDGIQSQDQWKKKIAGRSSSSSLFKHLSRLRFK